GQVLRHNDQRAVFVDAEAAAFGDVERELIALAVLRLLDRKTGAGDLSQVDVQNVGFIFGFRMDLPEVHLEAAPRAPRPQWHHLPAQIYRVPKHGNVLEWSHAPVQAHRLNRYLARHGVWPLRSLGRRQDQLDVAGDAGR